MQNYQQVRLVKLVTIACTQTMFSYCLFLRLKKQTDLKDVCPCSLETLADRLTAGQADPI